jgi:hypothetical protein
LRERKREREEGSPEHEGSQKKKPEENQVDTEPARLARLKDNGKKRKRSKGIVSSE